MSIERLVGDDVSHEEALLKNPDDFNAWLTLYRRKSSPEAQLFVLLRAVAQFPRSYKLWCYCLDVATEHLTQERVEALFQLALRLLDKCPMLWLRYLQYLIAHQRITLIRRGFDAAFRALPVSQHHLLWPEYLRYADDIEGPTAALIYRKYLAFAPPESLRKPEGVSIDVVIHKLVKFGDTHTAWALIQQVLTDMKPYLALGKTPVQFWLDYTELVTHSYRDMSTDEVEQLVLSGTQRFPDQIGRLYAKLVMFLLDKKDPTRARYQCMNGLKRCVTVKDFTLLYDLHVEIELAALEKMESRIDSDPALAQQFEHRMALLEDFLDNRELLLNDTKLRSSPNDLDEWVNRINIYKARSDTQHQLSTYVEALTKINPLKVIPGKHTLAGLWTSYALVYSSSNDLKTAALIYSKAVLSQFKTVEELADIYIAWSETLLEHGNEKESITTVKKALFDVPDEPVDYSDTTIPVQRRLHKCTKLWLFYIDLLQSMIDDPVENSAHVDAVKKAYEHVLRLKIATGQTIVDYASFLLGYNYYEQAFSVYELGIHTFTNPEIRFELWNLYLTKVLAYNEKSGQIPLERVRDLFDQCLDGGIPPFLSEPIFVLYSQYEHDKGSPTKAVTVLETGIKQVTEWVGAHYRRASGDEQKKALAAKFRFYQLAFSKLRQLNDKDKLRQVYSTALDDKQLNLKQVVDATLSFIEFETGESQLARVRSLFKYVTNLASPEELASVWAKWESFELDHGSESTFKDMLRFKLRVAAEHKNEVAFKQSINPIGFVKGTIQPDQNPDAIDLDMDM